jgi:hypothetical protein
VTPVPIPTLEECLTRAANARAEAERTSLSNVREQRLKAAEVWQSMAEERERYGDRQGRCR